MSISTRDNNIFKYIHLTPARVTKELEEKIKAEIKTTGSGGGKTDKAPESKKSQKVSAEELRQTVKDLESLNLLEDVELQDSLADTFLTLTASAIRKLSTETTAVLKTLGLDARKLPHNVLVDQVNAELVSSRNNERELDLKKQLVEGRVQSVGIANLHVVKQQIKRYEPAEIAHIENVLAGERKTRIHDELTSIEEFTRDSNEKTTDRETELSTTERFELNKQTTETFQKDIELGLELTLSGKYGPSISFDSNFKAGKNTSESESKEQSISFAKDTVDRSKERLIETIAVEKKTTLTRIVKENNEHVLKNESGNHKFAIYQYVDQIFESQVFDYGKRMMFDFVVPEPSSFLWYLKNNTTLKTNLEEPKKLEDYDVFDYRDITSSNYAQLGEKFGITDLIEPPKIYLTKLVRLFHNAGAESDSGKPKTGVSAEVDIPGGYQPMSGKISLLATSDENLFFSLHIGEDIIHLNKQDLVEEKVGGQHSRWWIKDMGMPIGGVPQGIVYSPDQKLSIDIYGYESANYNFHIELKFYAIFDPQNLEYRVITAWKKDVHGRLTEAYRNLYREYQQELAFQTAQASADYSDEVDFGSPPAVNKKLILGELKKHCLAILRNEHAGELVTDHVGLPPQFKIDESRENGELIRFLEHAFEWDQLQYVFYPYYWAKPETDTSGWVNRILSSHSDYTMDEFLKAGAARVVVPVRENFDVAVGYFIENNVPYNGLGTPVIEDPLYVSIVDEIKERTDAGKGEIPVGDSWETRLPTAAVIVRNSDALPSWTRDGGNDGEWTWKPDI